MSLLTLDILKKETTLTKYVLVSDMYEVWWGKDVGHVSESLIHEKVNGSDWAVES